MRALGLGWCGMNLLAVACSNCLSTFLWQLFKSFYQQYLVSFIHYGREFNGLVGFTNKLLSFFTFDFKLPIGLCIEKLLY